MTDEKRIEEAATLEAFELHGCLTGDCPHEKSRECFIHFFKSGVAWARTNPAPTADDAKLMEECKKVVDDWRAFWMNQTQNSKADYDNYFRRAMGVDANMGHHLARMFADFIAARANPYPGKTEDIQCIGPRPGDEIILCKQDDAKLSRWPRNGVIEHWADEARATIKGRIFIGASKTHAERLLRLIEARAQTDARVQGLEKERDAYALAMKCALEKGVFYPDKSLVKKQIEELLRPFGHKVDRLERFFGRMKELSTAMPPNAVSMEIGKALRQYEEARNG